MLYYFILVPWDYEEYSREQELDIATSLDAMVDATRSKIVSVRSDDPSRPVILAGIGVSAAIACQVHIFIFLKILNKIIVSKVYCIFLFLMIL
jgi:hypothetical protein